MEKGSKDSRWKEERSSLKPEHANGWKAPNIGGGE